MNNKYDFPTLLSPVITFIRPFFSFHVERFPEVLTSLMHYPTLDIYVTGSNSKFLSNDIITEFRGRGDEIHD